ncbi:MAG: hypothetical protein A4S09_01115 [Proteobacteria bacterium SG_bin7]|nr:MAG: hypothetical protein A4S09_01115 [Proteobacteria bacterium SG_bin7]
MVTVIVGHRGSGKTSFLHRWMESVRDAEFIDLDEKITLVTGKSASDLFESEGEKSFRHIEKEMFYSIYDSIREKSRNVVIALGAGFDFDLPEDVYVVWAQRETDLMPRTFLNRPRLESDLLPSEEYLLRAETRERKFNDIADEKILFPEGFPLFDERIRRVEERILLSDKIRVSGIITLTSQVLRDNAKFDFWLSRRRNWQDLKYEIRNDLLDQGDLVFALNCTRGGIFSYRQINDAEIPPEIVKSYSSENLTDWAIELGKCPFDSIDILSLHERFENETLNSALKRLECFGKGTEQLKAAPLVQSFAELFEGFEWQQQDPERRSFLPRSMDGRWRWFRVLMKERQNLNYIREGRGVVLDQPSFLEWVGHYNEHNRFAAVLGDPIEHSFTPAYQSNYFYESGTPILRIKVTEGEWDEAIVVLKKLGLKYAAVTSPLKAHAAELVNSSFPINTLYWNETKNIWMGENTDRIGAKKLREEKNGVAVWGGGGVLPSVAEHYPNASFYSASTGKLKSGSEESPEVVVWATGRRNMLMGTWPSSSWKPKKVVDLNYSDDSPGKEYAQLVGAEYFSGLPMFFAQADKQRDFWSRCEC